MEKLLRECYEEAGINGLNALGIQKRSESLERILQEEMFDAEDYAVLTNFVLGISDDKAEELLIDFEKEICVENPDFTGAEKEKRILAEILLYRYCRDYEDTDILLKVLCGSAVGCKLESETISLKMAMFLRELRLSMRQQKSSLDKLNAVQIETFKKRIISEKKNADDAGEDFLYSTEDIDAIVKMVDSNKRNIGILNCKLRQQEENLKALREESDMLWWLVNGWSDIYDCFFDDLSIEQGVLAIPMELDGMVRHDLGPVALRKLINKSLSSVAGHENAITLKQVMDACDDKVYENCAYLEDSVTKVQPVLCALICKYECREAADQNAWMGKFETECGKEILEKEFTPFEFAEHFCLELELAQSVHGK